jgi:CHASE3 domain sensor protein
MTDNTDKPANDFVDDTVKKVGDLADDAAKKAGAFADQARHAVDDTVAAATEAVRNFDLDSTTDSVITSAQVLAAETADNVTAAYKRNPALVITLGTIAVATITAILIGITKRR